MQGSRYNIEALSRGLGILELFTAKNPSLTLTEVAALLTLNKSTAFRILSTLETMGYLERDPASRRYRPSLKVLHLGFGAINRLEVRQVARQYLEQVAQELDETVSLAVLYGTDIIYVDRIRNRAIVGVVLDIGSHVPAHCTTMGKVLLANLEEDELQAFLGMGELTRYTSRTLTDKDILLKELEAIRRDGYATSDGELAIGLRAAGAPIRDNNGKAVAAIGISGSMSTINLQRLRKEIVPAVVRTAEQISLALGYIPIRVDSAMHYGIKGFS
jgi:PcaR/PcaU/PobR family beta-ketoadipate pathway transcriptional regulator